MLESLGKLVTESGFAGFFSNPDGWRNLVMIAIACVLLWPLIGEHGSVIVCCGLILVLRILAARFRWSLPKAND